MRFKNALKKNMLIRVLFFYTVFFTNFLHAKVSFTMTENCLKAQSLLYELKLDQAEKLLKSESSKDPDNIAIDWLEESALFLKVFITEDKAVYDKLKKDWAKMLKDLESKTFNNAWYNFVLSDMHIHQALIHLKFNESISAGTDIKSAFKYLKDNKKKFPAFLPDNKNLGFLTCLFSSVPSKYQWLTKLIGFEGDMDEGLSEINAYLKSGLNTREHVWLKLDAAFMYAMVEHHLNKSPDLAWNTIEPYTRNYKNVVIENYMRATVANYAGKNDEMYTVLMAKPPYAGTTAFYYLDYLLGICKLRKLDAGAENNFMIYTVKYKGKNYIKSAYRYMSWAMQLKGDEANAKTYYAMGVKMGASILEEDKQAEMECKESVIWHTGILKARLQFDGHYLDNALKTLEGINKSQLTSLKFKLEYDYRKARIYHEQGVKSKAIAMYLETIEKGRKSSYYYAAYSALQLGIIYESQGDKSNAKKYYDMAKSGFPENKEYVQSIEQKAKAGLKRIGK